MKPTKILIGRCYGGPRYSIALMMLLAKKKGVSISNVPSNGFDINRTVREMLPKDDIFHPSVSRVDVDLISAVEELGLEASGEGLLIVKVPSSVKWQIDNYDGSEWVAEKHRTWGRE